MKKSTPLLGIVLIAAASFATLVACGDSMFTKQTTAEQLAQDFVSATLWVCGIMAIYARAVLDRLDYLCGVRVERRSEDSDVLAQSLG